MKKQATAVETRDGVPVIEVEPQPYDGRGFPTVRFAKPCPWCGKRHIHGAEPDGGDPGDRVAHCANDGPPGRGYYLVMKREGD